MKKITQIKLLIILLVTISINLQSQEILKPTNEKTYREYMDKVLKPLIEKDGGKFKNGMLYDRVHPLAKLDVFNENDSINISNYEHFMRSWDELQKASINPEFISSKTVEEIAYSYERQNKIQIGIINSEFSYINPTALTPEKASLKIVNNKIEHIAERKIKRLKQRGAPLESTYLNKNVLVISPLNSKTIYTKEIVNFEFGNLYLENSSKKIKQLSASFENGEEYQIIKNFKLTNKTISQSFNNSGTKKIKFKVIFSDYTVITTYATFLLKIKSEIFTKGRSSNSTSTLVEITATKSFRGYDEPSNCGGTCYGKGEYKVFYANGNTSIKKPFVIVDGFDPSDARKIGTLSDDPVEDNTLVSSMYYGNKNLIKTLTIEGFDVVVLNFPKYIIKTVVRDDFSCITGGPTTTYNTYRDGGADYVERNGKVLEALLQKIKRELTANGSSEKLRIAGPSMGALIVQYALADMEKNNENHHTALFVSFDGPHNGANISIGLQKGLEYFDIELGLSALKSPAAKQMLMNHYLSGSEGLPQGAPNFRNRFQNMMNTLGFPIQSRNVAVINGSVVGTSTAQAGANMAHGDLTAFIGFLRRSLWVDYTSNSGKKQVFRYLKKNWWGANTQSDTKKYSTTSSSYGSLDNSPGGILEIKGRVEESLGGSFPYSFNNGFTNIPAYSTYFNFWERAGITLLTSLVGVHAYVNLTDNFSFVPTKSALGFSGTNKNWAEHIGCRNLVCTNETPFDSYYAPNENQEHASLHLEGINWLLNEVEGDPQTPSIYGGCTNSTIVISGNDRLCNGQTAAYSINNCSSSNVTWTTSSNLQVLSSSNQQIRVKNSTTNSSWIRVNLPNGQSISKNILGKPSVYYRVEQSVFPRISLYGIGTSIHQQGIYNTQWIKTGGTGQINNTNSFSTYATGSGSNWYVSGNVKVTNSCGTTTKSFLIRPSSTPCDELRFEKVTSNQYRIIRPCGIEPLRKSELTVNAELYNVYGIKKDLLVEKNIIYLKNMPKGSIMILKANSKGKTISKMIIID